MKKFTAIILTFVFYAANAQNIDRDSIKIAKPSAIKSNASDGFRTIRATQRKITYLILPAAAITYGFVSLENDELKKLNNNTKLEITEDHPRPVTKLDNYLQYSPAAAVYALNALGIKGKNNFRDRTIILGLSTIITTAIVVPLKHITNEQRPDGSDFYSFPSGHTATAFAAAEFMRQEYKDVSPWYGVAGYAAATATGILRLYNNKHWVGDVVAGAGFGVLSTRLAYWIYPAIKRKLFKDKPMHAMLMPFYQNRGGGISMVYNFGH
jgi:membrane-associated phospholipid phosphatase